MDRINGWRNNRHLKNPCYIFGVDVQTYSRKFNGGRTFDCTLCFTVSVVSCTGFTSCSDTTWSNSNPVSYRQVTTCSFNVIFTATGRRFYSFLVALVSGFSLEMGIQYGMGYVSFWNQPCGVPIYSKINNIFGLVWALPGAEGFGVFFDGCGGLLLGT